MSKIEIDNIGKIYENGFEALKEVSFSSKENEFIVVVGPSGCGKTTLLRLIAGLDNVTSGSIRIDDKDITDCEPKLRDVSMVFQNYALYPHMTVYENIAFPLKLRKMSKKVINERVEAIADMLDLTALLKRKPKTLSGGQRQRVAIGRAIIREPKIFIFDEPLSNLDADLRDYTRHEIKKLHKKLNSVFLYVTHDQVEAMTMGERIVVMKSGRIQQFDTPENIYKNPANEFVAKFIGSPKINFVSDSFYTHVTGKKLSSYSAKIGIRPEHISVKKDLEKTSDCVVYNIELLGKDIHLHLLYKEEQEITVCLPQATFDSDIHMGDYVKCTAKEEKILFFNKKEKFHKIDNQDKY